MTLSLYQRCLLAIRNSVEDGFQLPIHVLPLCQRKLVFNCFELHDSLQQKFFLRILEQHPEFLEGFDQLAVEHSRTECWLSFSVILLKHFRQIPNLTRTIVSLCLQVRHWTIVDKENRQVDQENNYAEVCGIVGQCRSLKRLTLTNWRDDYENPPRSSLLHHLADLAGRGERVPLQEMTLEFIRDDSEFQTFTGPLFEDLRSLTLEDVHLTPITYQALLAACRGRLGTLKVERCDLGDQSILPVILRSLEFLYVASPGRRPVLFPADVETLPEFSRLRYVSVAIEPVDDDEHVLEALLQLKAKVEISVGPTSCTDAASRIVERYGGNIVRLNLSALKLTHDLTDLIVNRCPNLTGLIIVHSSSTNVQPTYDLLQTFLGDESKAMKLRELGTVVPNSPEVIRRLFDVCRNLTRLYLYPKDGEFHPDSFAGLPTGDQQELNEIRLAHPTGITDDSLRPLLQRCGAHLKRIYVGVGLGDGHHMLTKHIYDTLFEHCRMIEDFELSAYVDREQQDVLNEIASRKLFRKVTVV